MSSNFLIPCFLLLLHHLLGLTVSGDVALAGDAETAACAVDAVVGVAGDGDGRGLTLDGRDGARVLDGERVRVHHRDQVELHTHVDLERDEGDDVHHLDGVHG